MDGQATVDVSANWAKDLADPRGDYEGKAFFGPKRGWTIDAGVPDAIAPFAAQTYAKWSFDPETNKHINMGLDRYDGLDGDTASKLLDTLPKEALAVRQNNGPTAGSMLAAAAANKGTVEVMGYGVGPGRRDERLSVEGVHIYDESITTEAQARAKAREMGMTSKSNPDEIAQVENPWRPGEKAWRLIWD